MHSRRLPALVTLAVGGAALAQTPSSPSEPWSLTEVARAECRGGAFFGASIAADSTRMLTIGERGVAIEWDLAQARERKRFASLPHAFAACMHPADPWAIVLADGRKPHAHRLDFGTGRYTELWGESVSHVAFDATGARVAVVFTDPNRGSRLAVYPEAALRTARPPAPDLERPFDGRWPDRVFFHPRGDAVFVASYGESWRVSLSGFPTTPATADLFGILADGTEVVETNDRYHPTVAGANWLAHKRDVLQRGGAAPGTWTVAEEYGSAALAADGTAVVPDEQGHLHLLGPAVDRRRVACGQPGEALQLCFDASSRYVAIVGGCMLTILDLEHGAETRLDGTFAVQASPTAGEFALLEARQVSTICAADAWRRKTAATLPENTAATTFERYWTGAVVLRQFLWLPGQRQVWLAETRGPADAMGPARLADGKLATFTLPHAADECPHQRGLAIATGPNGDVVLATTTRPVQCGNGLEEVRFWSTLRTYDGDSKERCARPLADVLPWMRTSPAGALVAVPANETEESKQETQGKVCIYTAHDLHPIHELALGVGPIVAWEFLDERTALASNGETLLLVQVTDGTAKRIPVVLPGPITLLAASAHCELVAIACASDVLVFRRE